MLIVAEPYRRLFDNLGLKSVEQVTAFFLPASATSRERVVVKPHRLSLPDQPPIETFFKQYRYDPPAWSFIGRRSKARCEFENYQAFARLNIPAAEPIAAGESRDALGRLRAAVIVTRTVPCASTLIEFMQGAARDRSLPEIRRHRRAVLRQLAAMTRRIHAAGFFHHDLVWRNVLVSTAAAEPSVAWIDCPRGGFVRWPGARQRRRIKDLASLDKPAGRWCTRGERVYFIREYLGLARLNPAARRLIWKTLRYRQKRWPEDWDGN